MENIEMALPLGGTLMMDEDAASIVAQIRNLLGQLRIKGITDKEIDTILSQQQKPGRAYINSRGMLVLPDEEKVTWYTNVSRIKRKITDKLGKRAAEQYIIRRGEDGLYRILAKKMGK